MSVCKNNDWGTVCDYNWNTNDATVVCRQLGLSAAGIFTTVKIYNRVNIHPCSCFRIYCCFSYSFWPRNWVNSVEKCDMYRK